MGAGDVLEVLRRAGLSVNLIDDKIIVAPRGRLTDPLRDAIRTHRDELVLALAPPASKSRTRRSSNLLMTPEQGDACHTPYWSDDEITTFVNRVSLFMRRGVTATDADDLAESLVLRDREGLDMRLCLECVHYRPGRCGNHVAAGIGGPSLASDLATMLQRCQGFAAP